VKAKEYLAQYNAAADKDEALNKVVLGLLNELKTILDQRNARSNHAVIAVLREQDQKFRAFARMVTDLPPDFVQAGITQIPGDMFERVVKIAMPSVHAGWKGT